MSKNIEYDKIKTRLFLMVRTIYLYKAYIQQDSLISTIFQHLKRQNL